MPDIRRRDYGRELEKKKAERGRKHRALRQLTAKFKKELAERKRREQGTVEGEAAEQSEQAAELFAWGGAERLTRTHGELSYRKQEETKAPRSEIDPSINLSYPRGEAAQKACRQGQRGRPQPMAGQRAQAGASARPGLSAAAKTPDKAPINEIPTPTADARTRRLALRRKRQERKATAFKHTGTKLIDRLRRGVTTLARGGRALSSLLLTSGGAAAGLMLFGVIVLAAAVMASPFGILFANEPTPDTIPLNAAVAEVGKEVCSTLAELQDGDYDSIDLTGALPNWREVIAVFAAKTAGAENGVDVATMDADRVDRLRAVFGDMTEITSEVETIHHDGGEDGEDWTERILHLVVTAKSAEEMSAVYRFTAYQKKALAELLDDPALLDALLYDLDSLQYDAAMLRRALPRNLSKERRAVVERALSLVGKVNYFWGGKSLVFGWDDRWGQLAKVTADGSSTTGTYRSYGLDCSGMVDWAFYNATDGSYIIGHGGGTAMQHSCCTPVRWEDAQIGDLAFYPDDEHVGIVAGWDKNGNIQIVHCASSYNNVVITGKEGFAAVGRPIQYGEWQSIEQGPYP